MPKVMDLEILRLLKMRQDTYVETGKERVVYLDELGEYFDLPKHELRSRCEVLETEGYIKNTGGFGPNLNPGYDITPWGRRYVIENN